MICGAFLSQDISQCKVQNLRNQTRLSVQGQHALSKVFCSLPGSVIPFKVAACSGNMCVHKQAPVPICPRLLGQRCCVCPAQKCAKVRKQGKNRLSRLSEAWWRPLGLNRSSVVFYSIGVLLRSLRKVLQQQKLWKMLERKQWAAAANTHWLLLKLLPCAF